MELRNARPEDRPHLKTLLERAGSFTPAEAEVALELIDDALAQGEASGYFLIVAADEAGMPVGYCCYGPTPMTALGTWDLYWVATDPEYRGRGVASALMAGMEADVRRRGGRQVRLETSELEGYTAARRLYERNHYEVMGRIPDFYRLGDTLLTFVKRL